MRERERGFYLFDSNKISNNSLLTINMNGWPNFKQVLYSSGVSGLVQPPLLNIEIVTACPKSGQGIFLIPIPHQDLKI